MERRRFFFSVAAAALGLAGTGRAATEPPTFLGRIGERGAPPATPSAGLDVSGTHAALFDMWFPIATLDIPPPIRPQIETTAAEVAKGMYADFSVSALLPLLEGMTQPALLPFSAALKASADPAVQAFLAAPGGFAGMPPALRPALFSFLFNGAAGPASMQLAMVLREAYLSGIWDLPLAAPLCNISPPKVFVDDPPAWARDHAPRLPASRLRYDAATGSVRHVDGPIEYLVVGSGPAGGMVAHQLQQAGKRVVLIERGPFVVWGSMDTRSYSTLMYNNNAMTTVNNSTVIRSGETLGGGTAVNIDLAFSPFTPNVQKHIAEWAAEGLIDGRHYTRKRIADAYQYVTSNVPNYQVAQSDLNPDNFVLWNGALAYGAKPSRYRLNRFRQGTSPSPVDDKHDSALELLYPAMEDSGNPLAVIPDAAVGEILFTSTAHGAKAAGVRFTAQQPWTTYGNTLVDPAGLGIPPGTEALIGAENVILCAGTIGTTEILARTAQRNASVASPRIGKGIVIHPSFPIIGRFNTPINMLDGLDSGVYVDSYAVEEGFIIEAMTGLPAYGALLVMGDGKQVYDHVSDYNYYAGYGVALIDTPHDDNAISLDASGAVVINYNVAEIDKPRFRRGIAVAVRMMFLAGAKEVVVPSNENFLNLPDFDPMRGVYLTDIAQADLLERNLQFTPNRTFLSAAHLQAANKMGPSHLHSVVSTTQRLWTARGDEVANVFVMDSSVFPTSVGANPMQSIYTFAKIFSDRVLAGA